MLHPCPEGYCCWRDQKMCVLEAAVGTCDIFTSSTMKTTTAVDDDVIPDYQCDETHLCPRNYCCLWDQKLCVNEALGLCNSFPTTPTLK